MANIVQVSRAAGVSTATVSRVFNKSGAVDSATRDAVLSAAKALGYRPRSSASRGIAAVLVEDYGELRSGGYVGFMVSALMEVLARKGLRIELVSIEDAYRLHENLYRGFFSLLYRKKSFASIAHLGDGALVSINEGSGPIPVVRSDENQGMDLAVGKLAEAGHTRIALYLPSFSTQSGQGRARGFSAALRRHAPGCPSLVLHRLEPAGAKAMAAKGVTALVAAGEDSGIKALRILQAAGLRAGADISLVAMEHQGVSGFLDPPLTTLVQDFTALAERALALMLEEIADPGPPIAYAYLSRLSVRALGLEERTWTVKNP